MKLKQVPAVRGASWVRQGFAVFVSRPIGFCGLFTTFLFVGLLVSGLLPFGGVLFIAAFPLLTLAFMLATQRALQGGFPMPTVFIEPLRQSRAQTVALLLLGATYVAGAWAAMALCDVLDGGAMDRFFIAFANVKVDASQAQALLNDPALQRSVFYRGSLVTLWSVPFLHAPTLVHWGRYGAAKALFASSLAIWRNKGAFGLFALSWFMVSTVFSLCATILSLLLGAPAGSPVVAMPMALVMFTIFYASLFFTFADCFDVVLDNPPPPAPAEDPPFDPPDTPSQRGPE